MCQNMFSSIPDVNRHSVKFIWEGKNREEKKKSSFYYRLIMRRNLNEWDLTKQRRLWLLLPSPFAACLPCTFLDDFTCEEVLIKVNKKKKRNFWMIFAFKILHKASRNFFLCWLDLPNNFIKNRRTRKRTRGGGMLFREKINGDLCEVKLFWSTLKNYK